MTLEELQNWILGEGLGAELDCLARYSAARSVGLSDLDIELLGYVPDWQRLLFGGSILTKTNNPRALESALMVAHAGLLFSDDQAVVDGSATLLAQLANHRAVLLAEQKGLLQAGLDERLGASEQMLMARRELSHSVFLANGDPLHASPFQRQFWDDLNRSNWVSASAPTASGKTYLVLRWLLNEFARGDAKFAIFLAPTRALVGEIERQILELAPTDGITNLRVASLPIAGLGDGSRPTILVFTQERLHVFLNSLPNPPPIDIAIIDEVHKLGDGLRGVILQDAIERIERSSPKVRFVFLSPLTDNPAIVLEDAPTNITTSVVPSEAPTVTQNLLTAEQLRGNSRVWRLRLQQNDEFQDLGTLLLHAKPDTQIKRLSYVALALGEHQTGTLIYANGAAEAEKIAWQVFNSLDEAAVSEASSDPELLELSDFARSTVHPRFQLVDLVKRGVAFHYGNMPTLLRSEIERLFRIGKIRFLICTSTLVEGVNLACRTIVVRGPRKGVGKPMSPHDFWNLAGRAGRWGQDFHGNIVCVDVNRADLWPQGAPRRTRYPIKRETEVVLSDRDALIPYLMDRALRPTASLNPQLEQVTAYLLGWLARQGTFLSAPAASRLEPEYARELDRILSTLIEGVDLPAEILARHPGVSAVALQSLLNYFRKRTKPIEELVPYAPDNEHAFGRLIAVFSRINQNLFPAFARGAIPLYALVTVAWMRGLPLAQIIRNRLAYLDKQGRQYNLAAVIRDTMRDVEEVARFKAPKYLAAYVDVLKFHLNEIGQQDIFPDDLQFDLFLEFGVSTGTLLALIGIGLSRTSAVAINEFFGSDQLSEDEVVAQLSTRQWETMDLPAIVRREISSVLVRRLTAQAT